MAFGYARASTFDQEEALHPDALTAPGRQRIFVDGASGKLESRPALDHTHLARVIVVDGHYARWVDAPDLLLVIYFQRGRRVRRIRECSAQGPGWRRRL
jgi:hypothetical protein